MQIGLGYSLDNTAEMVKKAVRFTLRKVAPRAKTYPHFLSVNPDKNRAARRSFVKIRHTTPGAFGANQRARMLAWQLKSMTQLPA